ncbi:hypothetical protein ABT160_10325 [Streptomyces sp. NPDC001941]
MPVKMLTPPVEALTRTPVRLPATGVGLVVGAVRRCGDPRA